MHRMVLLSVALLVAASTAGTAAARSGDGVWVNGSVHALVTGPPKTAARAHATPLYVIAPVSAAHPLHALADALTHGFGAHDHVAASVFSGPCDITLIVPGPRAGKSNIRTRATLTPVGKDALVYAALIGGKMDPLTSVSRIDAAEKAGLIKAIDTHTVIFCKVSG